MKVANGFQPAAVIEHEAQTPFHRRDCCSKTELGSDGKCRAQGGRPGRRCTQLALHEIVHLHHGLLVLEMP